MSNLNTEGDNAMEKPNIVFILADDMGYGDVSCQNPDGKITTPNMDQMADDGMRFTDAHASTSVCTPSRYGILTGRYAWRGRLKQQVLWPYYKALIEKDVKTLPQFLKEDGYSTACVGKWHLGMDYPFKTKWVENDILERQTEMMKLIDADIDWSKPIENGPNAFGFDYYFGVDVPNFPPYCFIENNRTVGTPDRIKPDDMYGAYGSMVKGWDLENIMPALTDKACNFIEEKAKCDEPFFLYFSLTGPHTPIVPTEKYKDKSDAGIYGDWVMQMDGSVGSINKAIKRAGIEDNTLVVMTSDNGSPGRDGHHEKPGTVLERYNHNPSWILRGMKADTWDGGHRVPFIVKWPSKIKAGSECDELVCLMDFYGTIAGITDRDLPDTAWDTIDIYPYLEGKSTDAPIRDSIVHHGYNGLYGIRKDEWKLILGSGSGGFSPNPKTTPFSPPCQLYNMKEDIQEENNRYFEMPEIVKELEEKFHWCKYNPTNK